MTTNSYTITSRCPKPTTTDCVEYVGANIPCLGICTGDTLTSVECAIANAICELFKDIDLSDPSFTSQIPACFSQAFATGDYSIQNYILTLLIQACEQQNLLQSVISGATPIQGINPIISISYPSCCTPSGCGSSTNVTFSQHIINVLTCLCNLYTLVGTPPQGYTSFGCSISTILASINQIIINENAQSAAILEIQTVLRSAGYTINSQLPSPVTPPAGC